MSAPAGRPAHPLARPRASPSASARCALRLCASRGGYRLGRASVLGVECKEREKSRICLSPRARERILADAPALTLARVLAHYLCKRFRPSGRGRVKVLGGDIIEDGTEGISMLFGAPRHTPTCAKGADEADFGREACFVRARGSG